MEQQLQLESAEKLQTSRKQLEAEVVDLRQEIEVQERQNENIERFIRTADKYVDIEEIDPCMLRELIKAIYVEAPDKSSGKRRQNIHIKYDGIGFIPLEELAKKETAWPKPRHYAGLFFVKTSRSSFRRRRSCST